MRLLIVNPRDAAFELIAVGVALLLGSAVRVHVGDPYEKSEARMTIAAGLLGSVLIGAGIALWLGGE